MPSSGYFRKKASIVSHIGWIRQAEYLVFVLGSRLNRPSESGRLNSPLPHRHRKLVS